MRTGIGTALPRVDGRLKVTGAARYAAEHPAEDLLYGVVVSSSIATRPHCVDRCRGRLRVPGVIDVITHENRPRVALRSRSYPDGLARRPAARSSRSMTPRSILVASRSRWWSPRPSRQRVMPRRWSRSNTSASQAQYRFAQRARRALPAEWTPIRTEEQPRRCRRRR